MLAGHGILWAGRVHAGRARHGKMQHRHGISAAKTRCVMTYQFDDLVDRERIVAIDSAPIPAPPASSRPGEHLFVNCHYAARQADHSPQELLDLARSDALQIVGRLAATGGIGRFVSAIVTVYGHFPVAGAERPARRRIYRVGILPKDLPRNGATLTPHYFAQVHAEESSELDDVAELLHAPAS